MAAAARVARVGIGGGPLRECGGAQPRCHRPALSNDRLVVIEPPLHARQPAIRLVLDPAGGLGGECRRHAQVDVGEGGGGVGALQNRERGGGGLEVAAARTLDATYMGGGICERCLSPSRAPW